MFELDEKRVIFMVILGNAREWLVARWLYLFVFCTFVKNMVFNKRHKKEKVGGESDRWRR